MVWRWVGHVLRLPSIDLVRQSFTELQHSDVTAHGIRRCRTGPNNSGHGNVLRYLNHCGLDAGVAACRQQWAEREHGWLVAHGLPVAELFGANVFATSSTKYLWERRCLPGKFHGQQLIVCEWLALPPGTSGHSIQSRQPGTFSGNRVASAQHSSLGGASFQSRLTC